MIVIHLLVALFSAVTPKPRLTVAVVYFNPVDKSLKQELNKSITATYNCSVTEITGTLPVEAYYASRNRYRAPVLLDHLNKQKGFDKVVGVTSKDISTTKKGIYDWGVFGLGFCPGQSCVVSTFRMATTNKQLFNDRFIKVTLHEIGHTIGLPHCDYNKTCLMNDAKGSINTVDRESRSLCAHCKKQTNYTR